jgi:hypothetical protein
MELKAKQQIIYLMDRIEKVAREKVGCLRFVL